jgi:hypothetical protein
MLKSNMAYAIRLSSIATLSLGLSVVLAGRFPGGFTSGKQALVSSGIVAQSVGQRDGGEADGAGPILDGQRDGGEADGVDPTLLG